MNKRPPVMEDYLRFRYVGDPGCFGNQVAWTSSFWDTSAPEGLRRFREQICLASLDHDRLTDQRIVTAGGNTERCPGFGSDGSFYFLSDAALPVELPEVGSIPGRLENEFFRQLQLYRRKDGRMEQLTHFRHGIEHYRISPDGKSILLELFRYDGETDDRLLTPRTSDELLSDLSAQLAEPFTTEDQRFKSDAELGYCSHRKTEFWLLTGNTLRQLANDMTAPMWMPDSRRLLFQRAGEDGHLSLRTLDTQTGTEALLASVTNADPCFDDSPAAVDEANDQILFAANDPGMAYSDPRALFAVPLTGGEGLEARRLIAKEADVDGLFPQDNNFLSRGTVSDEWLIAPDGNVYYTTGLHGHVRIASVPLTAENAAPTIRTGCFANYHSLSITDDGRLLCLCGLPDRLPELALIDPADGSQKILTDSNPWMEEVMLQIPESVTTASGTQGFYLPPVNADRAPVICYAHGGPTGFYCSGLNYELQVMAAAGFGVLYANPRGGTGFGRERGADHFAYDGAALADTEEFLDTVCALHPELDADRVGICGGSYGGYLTLYAAIHSRRFRAACAHRALSNMLLISYASHSAGGHSREETPKFSDHMHSSMNNSLTSFVDRIQIPLLLLHSTQDANCIPEQARQIFAAMRSRNPDVPCRFVLYPDSCHGLGHKGPMELAVHHRNANLEWFQKYL